MKKCRICKEEKPLEEFHNHIRSKDGRQANCKPCQIKRVAANKYGITDEQYDELQKDSACACCGRTREEIGGKKPMAIDHNHGTGEVRDMLCRYCNVALGMLYEDITRVRQLGVYILKHEHDVCTTQEHRSDSGRRLSGFCL